MKPTKLGFLLFFKKKLNSALLLSSPCLSSLDGLLETRFETRFDPARGKPPSEGSSSVRNKKTRERRVGSRAREVVCV